MAVLSDFLAAVNQIAAERGIEPDDVMEAVKEAIRTGYKNNYDTGESLIIDIDEDKGKVLVYADKKIVKKVTNQATQISLKEARMIEPKLKVGDHVQVDVTPEGDFGRIAVQAAKQVILQKIREVEKEAVMKEFKDKVGTVESGIIQRMDGDNVIVEIYKAQAIMPAEERLPGEFYKSGARLKFLLKKIHRTVKGKQLIVSRADPKFLEELFALEVPEIRSGSVEIKAIAREAGSRSKVAVVSNQEGVDPIGACVGQKGIRIDNITDELKGEKIDIILWDEDTGTFIANSLSPAQAEKISIDKDENIAKVTVPDDQLSLAIGKDGQNVRLAAKLTEWKIDIRGKEEAKKEKQEILQQAQDKEGKKTMKKAKKVKKTEKKTKAKEKKALRQAQGTTAKKKAAKKKASASKKEKILRQTQDKKTVKEVKENKKTKKAAKKAPAKKAKEETK
ncbi:transcription termination/antitermination protein NusA [Candidatus Dojkabacteria bacterium]|nr:transcription termination/antitermination protein NusA [Candidatus Dojkabacteria bacterium]